MAIDPTSFTIAVSQAEATVQQAEASVKYIEAQMALQQTQISASQAQLDQAQALLMFAQQQTTRFPTLAQDGYVTNLQAKLGDFANTDANTISAVDANSFCVDGNCEETNLAPSRVGDPTRIKLMGHRKFLRGHVDSIARAIDVANAQPATQGTANVNPIFTWVRLAQRIPVRIHLDEMPSGVVLSAGMTATVEIDVLDRGRGMLVRHPTAQSIVDIKGAQS